MQAQCRECGRVIPLSPPRFVLFGGSGRAKPVIEAAQLGPLRQILEALFEQVLIRFTKLDSRRAFFINRHCVVSIQERLHYGS